MEKDSLSASIIDYDDQENMYRIHGRSFYSFLSQLNDKTYRLVNKAHNKFFIIPQVKDENNL